MDELIITTNTVLFVADNIYLSEAQKFLAKPLLSLVTTVGQSKENQDKEFLLIIIQ